MDTQFVLHGSWSNNAFFVWAERARKDAGADTPAPSPDHPAAASPNDLCTALTRIVPLGGWHPSMAGRRVVLLPSTPAGPLLPPWFETKQGDSQGSETKLRPWRVFGLELDALAALDLLVAIPASAQRSRVWGSDLVYWAWAAKLALELLVKQKVIPGIVRLGARYEATWLPMTADPADESRLHRLAKAMPPACRALFEDNGVIPLSDRAIHAEELLDGFVQAIIDGALRDWGRASRSPRRPGEIDIGTAWWTALWSDDPTIWMPETQRRKLAAAYHEWQQWARQLYEGSEPGYRLCFRLQAPVTLSESQEPLSDTWTLSYMLQATDDPSLLIPAEQVWTATRATRRYLQRRFEGAQEKLLAGLWMAAQAFAPIQASLRTARPSYCSLSAEEAYTFLREIAPLLQFSGFGVLVPPWTRKRDARLGVRAKIKSEEVVSSGLLSMKSLVGFEWELALGDQTMSRQEFERLAALKTPLVQVRGKWVMLHPDEVEAAIAFWEKKKRQDNLPLSEALRLALGADDTSDGLAIHDVETTGWVDELLQALQTEEKAADLPAPDGFVGTLRPYQRRGFAWLAFLRRWGMGACLADDMGLGKTIQAIALLLCDRQGASVAPSQQPALVICPTSVVGNWKREVNRFAPQLRVLVHHGGERAREDQFVAAALEYDVVISTYGLARRDVQELTQVHWSDVILDEAQNIKNPQAKQSQAIRKLGSDNRIALTGTPVENRLSELWSIMQFLNPGLLGSQARFRKRYALPIERYQDAEKTGQLKRLVGPFILRRLKTDETVIQDLPEKMEQKVYCNLTAEQATLYQAVVEESMQEVETAEEGFARRGLVLGMLMRLKQVCNHPAQFLKDHSALPGRSGKLERLSEMLEEALDVGDRALVFTQFAEMGRMLHTFLQSRFGIEALFLHGGTPQKQRDNMIQRFQHNHHGDGPSVFVLSLKAGGTGLNLTAANHVFHFDRWWNPAVENQATDRAYRIGQKRNVQVHKLICAGTLEERIDALIESKRALAESVIGAGESWLSDLSTDQIAEIVTLGRD